MNITHGDIDSAGKIYVKVSSEYLRRGSGTVFAVTTRSGAHDLLRFAEEQDRAIDGRIDEDGDLILFPVRP